MRLIGIICILLLICSACPAEDLIFFADDHYKAVGFPQLNASVVNPYLEPGNSVLQIALANNGRLDELMPINGGAEEDATLERQAEMHSVDAQNVKASLVGTGPLTVTSGECQVASLPSGAVAMLRFNLSVGGGDSGWYELLLRLDYERQADVSVSNGEVSPLYLPENLSTRIMVFVKGFSGPLRIMGTESEISPGKSGTIMAVVKNDGQESLSNCTARLIATPPFHAEGSQSSLLGDLSPGALAVASFPVRVDGNASQQDYQLGCIVSSDAGQTTLAIPLTLTEADNSLWTAVAPILILLIIASLAAFWLLGRRRLGRRKRWI